MSLVQKAVRGAAWTTVTSMLARVVSLVATMLVTHKIPPDDYGQASAAVVVVLTANALSTFFLGNYLIIDKTHDRSAAWHAHLIHQLTGFVALGATIPLAPWIARWVDAPRLGAYLPLTVVAFLLLRLSIVPEKLLVRDLRFRYLAITRMLAELAYAVVTVGGALLGWGGMALIAGALARTSVKAAGFCVAVPWRDWTEPHAFDGDVTRRMFRYGLPLWLSGVFGFIGANWDNLLVSRYFGPGVMAAYSLAFNLADVPATQVGEQLCEVLLPSLAKLGPEHRKTALVKSMLVVSLVTFPIVVGLGAVSQTMVASFFNAKWAAVAPLLSVLSIRSLGRTTYYPLTQYMQANDRNRDQMLLGILYACVLLATLITLGARSPVLTCAGVATTQLVVVVAGCWIVGRQGVPLSPIVLGHLRILIACAAMVGAVVALRWAIAPRVSHATLRLVAEIVVGAMVYVPVALIVARAPARDLISWGRRGLGRGEAVAA